MTSTEAVVVVGDGGPDVGRGTTFASLWSWREQALCRDMDSVVFFPPDRERGSVRSRREQAAKAVCAVCPVRHPCAVHALVNRERHGVWGGLSEADRRAIDAPPGPTPG